MCHSANSVQSTSGLLAVARLGCATGANSVQSTSGRLFHRLAVARLGCATGAKSRLQVSVSVNATWPIDQAVTNSSSLHGADGWI
jgi:hypothetical protein